MYDLKIMDPFDIPKIYDSKTTDSKWYAFWEQNNFFKADANSQKPPYCIVIPPPNVTGALHMGHALVNTIQDALIRWKRMSGYEALWVPGTDHAGISTQTVVERHLMAKEGKRRKDYSRDEFLTYVWQWKEQYEHRIIGQLKMMGCSCDWSRLRFTMDQGCNKAVRTIFKKLFDDGLIYRGNYLVNWDPVTQTAIADDEVEYEERQSSLWFFKYPITNSTRFITVATTRPETMLGDTAIAVNPQDERYSHLIGQTVTLPLMNRTIPIIADHHVDPAFGTGAVKITPAHDPNDYQMGLEHRLAFINIMTSDGKINENGGRFAGLTREEARKAVVASLQELDLVEKIEPHVLRVGVSYRSKAIIEPYMSKQWFVKMDQFASNLKLLVETKQVKIIPAQWEATYFHWVNNLRDWCISRQLWWGHRIPVWYNKNDPDRLLCFSGEGVPPEVAENPEEWQQDEDVLDTWFSSALWPFSTLGWPDETQELEKFYPNAVLVTGHDILFFWVARMLIMGQYTMGQPPFPETFLHGLIYGKSYWRANPDGGITYIGGDEKKAFDLGSPLPHDVHSKWEKLSKSKGNVIDPLDLIEEYGTDAMRMALCAGGMQTSQIDLDRRRFEEFKNFANKIWNGARFIFMNLSINGIQLAQGLDHSILTLEDRWILSALNRVVLNVNQALEAYAFDQAALKAYDFFWKEFCAYYLEIAKPVLFGKTGTSAEQINKQRILVIVLSNIIRLLHPMAPFITEELFQLLKSRFELDTAVSTKEPYINETLHALNQAACIVAPFPQVISHQDIQVEIEDAFALMEQIVYCIRNIRGEMKLPPGLTIDIYIVGQDNDQQFETIKHHLNIIAALVKTNKVLTVTENPKIGFAATGVYNQLTIVIPVPQELQEKEKQRLEKEKEKLIKSIERLKQQLDNSDFVTKAKPELIEQQRKNLSQSEKEYAEILTKLMING